MRNECTHLSLSDLIHNTELPLIVLRRALLCAVEWIKASTASKSNRANMHHTHLVMMFSPICMQIINKHVSKTVERSVCLHEVTALFHRIINIKIQEKTA
jgi:hypothetical protein